MSENKRRQLNAIIPIKSYFPRKKNNTLIMLENLEPFAMQCRCGDTGSSTLFIPFHKELRVN